jgi:hypothetical protein
VHSHSLDSTLISAACHTSYPSYHIHSCLFHSPDTPSCSPTHDHTHCYATVLPHTRSCTLTISFLSHSFSTPSCSPSNNRSHLLVCSSTITPATLTRVLSRAYPLRTPPYSPICSNSRTGTLPPVPHSLPHSCAHAYRMHSCAHALTDNLCVHTLSALLQTNKRGSADMPCNELRNCKVPKLHVCWHRCVSLSQLLRVFACR